MKFKYLGDREQTSLFGYTFPINEPVEVTKEQAINKLKNNSHFELVEEKKEAPKPKRNTRKKVDNGTDSK